MSVDSLKFKLTVGFIKNFNYKNENTHKGEAQHIKRTDKWTLTKGKLGCG